MSKALVEQRNDLQAKMQAIVDKAKAEQRAVSADERTMFDDYKNKIADIDATIKLEEEVNSMDTLTNKVEMTAEQQDYKAMADFIRTNIVNANLTKDANGVVIPASIANKIIDKVNEICPIYQLATKYNVKGTFSIPYVDTETDDITVAYSAEFVELTAHAHAYKSIELKGFLYGALTLVSRSLINNSDFDLVGEVVNRMAHKIAEFLERELINGTTDKVKGIIGSYDAEMEVESASATAVTAEELIDLQEKVPDKYQANAIWLMDKATRKAIRKLKDGQGNFLLQKDFTSKWGYTLLDKPVYVSDNMPALGAGQVGIIYGDLSGLACKEVEVASAQVLQEKYATQHAVGVVAWGEVDARIENAQKIACLVGKRG